MGYRVERYSLNELRRIALPGVVTPSLFWALPVGNWKHDEALSHGSTTPRLLRVIVWTGATHGHHVTFWNKEHRNPVVPDPVFILRPQRPQ